jgi:hypothetical protein
METNATILADLLHEKTCRFNHTDYCGWHYESWENPGYAKKRFLEKANDMLNEAQRLNVSAEAVFSIVEKV